MLDCKKFIKDIYSSGNEYFMDLYKNAKIKSGIFSKILKENEPDCLKDQISKDILTTMNESKDNLKDDLELILTN